MGSQIAMTGAHVSNADEQPNGRRCPERYQDSDQADVLRDSDGTEVRDEKWRTADARESVRSGGEHDWL
jgi:hypothetical protein